MVGRIQLLPYIESQKITQHKLLEIYMEKPLVMHY